jgi:hypothetical protein
MTQTKSGDAAQSAGGGDAPRRKARRRTVLNLGMPFLQIDDFVNQSEDAVALGYKVLVETVEEIKKGYAEAKAFHDEQKEFEDGHRPTPPPIPWEQLVERLSRVQNIGLNAVKGSTDIFLDSMRAGMTSTKRFATTWAQSREDLDENPVLAGPVFEEVIEVTVHAGDAPVPVQREISHRGLMRLRINAVVKPAPRELGPEPGKEPTLFAGRIDVRFEPAKDELKADRDVSVLDIEFAPIPAEQTAGVYEGLIRASNFELLIARLRINVVDRSDQSTTQGAPPKKTRLKK